MIEQVQLPEISENVDAGVVVGILVKPGDYVVKEQSVVELETDKATFEVPCPVAGKVVEIKVSEEDEVKVGQVILTVDTDAGPEDKEPSGTKQASPPTAASEPTKQTSGGESKIEKEPPAQQRPQAAPQKEPAEPVKRPSGRAGVKISASPAVRRLARELGIDISQVAPSGAGGRISREDVENHAKALISSRQPSGAAPTELQLPDFSQWGPTRREAMTVTRKKIAETLSYAWRHVPHVTQYDEADITELQEFRAEYSEAVEAAGGKLTVTSILLKVTASAIAAFPKFNASVDAQSNEIIFKDYCNVCVAVDTDRGLLVPVVRDVDKKTILQLAVELKDLAEKARGNKLTPDDMLGGTFTISNLGGIGGTGFSPIVYWPQVAILGVARSCEKARYTDGENLHRRTVLPLSLSYDHRIIDGSEGVRFLRFIVERLEKPFLLAVSE